MTPSSRGKWRMIYFTETCRSGSGGSFARQEKKKMTLGVHCATPGAMKTFDAKEVDATINGNSRLVIVGERDKKFWCGGKALRHWWQPGKLDVEKNSARQEKTLRKKS
jgi:hypothetical protein